MTVYELIRALTEYDPDDGVSIEMVYDPPLQRSLAGQLLSTRTGIGSMRTESGGGVVLSTGRPKSIPPS